MKWQIPAKTFLLGEYAALKGESAIVLTTSPCFEFSISSTAQDSFHPASPAGFWWAKQTAVSGFKWSDPYQGRGGLGASSAEFLGAYLASCYFENKEPTRQDMMAAYDDVVTAKAGSKPSGYDVIAQSQNHCVYINRQNNVVNSYPWVFEDISFLLLHSGQKLATHSHLETIKLPDNLSQLSELVDHAKLAFEQVNSHYLIEAIKGYQQQLNALNFVAASTTAQLAELGRQKEILAAKGCGALGADVLLLIVEAKQLALKIRQFTAEGWKILATNENLYLNSPLLKK